MQRIAKTAIIHPGVQLPKDILIEDFCVIGVPVEGKPALETRIGEGAVIRSHTVIYAGNVIGKNFRTGHKANIREMNTIGNDVSIGTMSVVEHQVQIEDSVRIHTSVFIPEFSILRKGAWVGPGAILTNAKFPNLKSTKKELKGPVLEASARIGAGAILLPGITVGESALVGAGAVVTKNVSAKRVVRGNPAQDTGPAPVDAEE